MVRIEVANEGGFTQPFFFHHTELCQGNRWIARIEEALKITDQYLEHFCSCQVYLEAGKALLQRAGKIWMTPVDWNFGFMEPDEKYRGHIMGQQTYSLYLLSKMISPIFFKSY